MRKPSANYFSLFGLNPNFEIDETQLAKTFRQLRLATHPDRYASSSDFERRTAVAQAATINDAYHTLRDPLRRARYLLELHGIEIQGNKSPIMDAEFLLEQMELRERLAEIRTASNIDSEMHQFKDLLHARRTQLFTEIADCLRIPNAESLQKATDCVRRLQFFERLAEEID